MSQDLKVDAGAAVQRFGGRSHEYQDPEVVTSPGVYRNEEVRGTVDEVGSHVTSKALAFWESYERVRC